MAYNAKLKWSRPHDTLAIVMRKIAWVSLFAASVCALPAQEKVDLYTINRIKHEAFDNSKVMENAYYLTDVYGPRLTGSPGVQAAGDWAVRKLNEWGLSNARREKWGPFGRGWYCTRFV